MTRRKRASRPRGYNNRRKAPVYRVRAAKQPKPEAQVVIPALRGSPEQQERQRQQNAQGVAMIAEAHALYERRDARERERQRRAADEPMISEPVWYDHSTRRVR